MMYLSKGLLVQETGGDFCVSHGGRLFVLGHEMAALWSAARLAPQAVPDAKAHYIERLRQSGLAVTTEEAGGLANYRLLCGCIKEGRPCSIRPPPNPLWTSPCRFYM